MTLVTIMSVLAVFTVDYAKDEYGNEIPVTGEHTVDVPMLRYVEIPQRLSCDLTPSSYAVSPYHLNVRLPQEMIRLLS